MRLLLCGLALGTTLLFGQSNAELREQVRKAEMAFAKTMADRDHAAFQRFLSSETVFLPGGGAPALRGPAQVAAAWKKLYEGPKAPFSWAPDSVEVLDSGRLALSTGPVMSPEGKRTGTFNSVWRREADGEWKVLFDNGCPRCDCGAPK